MFSIEDGRAYFYQWDKDRKLVIDDSTITQVHFCNKTDDCSLVCNVYTQDGKRLVNVPNILLTDYWRINVYGYDSNYTKHSATFDVKPRTKPADYIYTEEELKEWEQLSKDIEAVEKEIEVVESDIAKVKNNMVGKKSSPYNHAETFNESNTAIGYWSHAEGLNTTARGEASHTEGNGTTADGEAAHAEGYKTVASGKRAHTEGDFTEASAQDAHAEGYKTVASGAASHAEGSQCQATGDSTHAEGVKTVASGKYSHAQGSNTIAAGPYQSVRGKWNIADSSGTYVDIVGYGGNEENRKNIYTLDTAGNGVFAGGVTAREIILIAPNGTKYRVCVNNNGALTTAKV